MKALRWLVAATLLAGCIYEGREPGIQVSFPDDGSDAGAKLSPTDGWNSGSTSDAGPSPGDAAPDADAPSDAAGDAPTWPTPESVATGDAYQLAVRGDAFAAYVQVIVGGSLDTQLQLRESGISRVLQNGVQILARNRVLLDDASVAASNRDGVFAYPRAAGPRVDVAFGFVPQGVQLAGLGPAHVYYLRPSSVGFDELHRRSRADSTDEVVACSVSTSAFDVSPDGFAVMGRPGGTYAVPLGPIAGSCVAETAGTKLSSAANPALLLVGSARVVIGTDVGPTTSLTAVPRGGGASETIGGAAVGLWGVEPTRPLAELDDTLFYVEDTGAESYVVEHPAGEPARRLVPVGYRQVRAVAANATHVYFSTKDGVFRVAR